MFSEKEKHHKPRLALNNFTARVREREDENRTRVAGHLNEIQGVVANTLNGARGNGAAGKRATWMGRPERVSLPGRRRINRGDIDGKAEGRMSGSE